MGDNGMSGALKCVIFVAVIVAVGISILIIASFGYLDYYELGFARQKTTGVVDKSKVYTGGRYFIGPDFEFKVFPADLHFIDLKDSKIFSSDKLEVLVTVHLQYVIRKEELVSLHDNYDLDYKDAIESSALDALKGAVTIYNVRELISNRSSIEGTIFKTVRERLGGTCCNSFCGETDPMCKGCMERSICTQDDKGLNVEVRYLQLVDIDIPETVGDRFTTALVEQEQAEEEILKQEAVIVRKETSKQVQLIKNAAAEISENATAQAQLLTTLSNANYTAMLETARSDGLKLAFSALNFNQQNQKNSFDYLRTIRGHENIHLTVDYQQRIAGNLG